MNDCSYVLYESLRNRYPSIPATLTGREATERLETALVRTKSFPSEYQHDIFEIRDSLDILAFHQAHHAFLLGLDLGLSIARDLDSFQPNP